MPFQNSVNSSLGGGVIGEIAIHGPKRGKPGILDSADPTNNVVGRWFTLVDATSDRYEAGGDGLVGGLLVGPKTYAMEGTAAGSLEPTLTLKNEINAEFLDMASGVTVNLPSPFETGDHIVYKITSGEMGSLASLNPGDAVPAGYALLRGAKVESKIDGDSDANDLAVISLFPQLNQ